MRTNWLRKTGITCLMVMLVITAGAVIAQADVIPVDPIFWTGDQERARDDFSLAANNTWDNPAPVGTGGNGFEIYWDISLTGTTYHYQYTISGQEDPAAPATHLPLSSNLLALFLQTSPFATAGDFTNVEFNGAPFAYTVGAQSINAVPLGYGMKLTGLFGTGPLVFSFDTEKEPVWGNFLAGDGIGTGTRAFNLGFGSSPTAADGPEFTRFIPTPDTLPIPLPPSALLLGTGLLGLVGWRVKFRKS